MFDSSIPPVPASPTVRPTGYVPPGSASELIGRYTKGERYFAGAQLERAKLCGARLWQVNLSHANLQGADFSDALLEDSDFSGADLTGANLTEAKCHGAKFDGAILSQAQLPGRDANWPDANIISQASDIYRGRNENIFVSYARVDQTLVAPLVGLIRSLGSRVFMDITSIIPGDKWRPVLTQALADASVVVVFWCKHSASSREVEGEYMTAHTKSKNIIPVLLDNTPVSPPLSDYQWLDFNGTFASHDPSKTHERILADARREGEMAKIRERERHESLGMDVHEFEIPPPRSLNNYQREDIEVAKEALLRVIAARIEPL
jgi:TIR domain/Pentapeptide repeats (8 copies)